MAEKRVATTKTTVKVRETGGQQPEALATFAAAARGAGKKPDAVGLEATKDTAPLKTSPDAEAKAATRTLREGVYHDKEGAKAARDALPDRTRGKG
jgi:hypothetical protein